VKKKRLKMHKQVSSSYKNSNWQPIKKSIYTYEAKGKKLSQLLEKIVKK
jgi:hypothetical protein